MTPCIGLFVLLISQNILCFGLSKSQPKLHVCIWRIYTEVIEGKLKYSSSLPYDKSSLLISCRFIFYWLKTLLENQILTICTFLHIFSFVIVLNIGGVISRWKVRVWRIFYFPFLYLFIILKFFKNNLNHSYKKHEIILLRKKKWQVSKL